MTDDARAFLLDLLNTPSPSGFEAEGQRKWAAYVRKVAPEAACDPSDSAWARLEGSQGPAAPTLLLLTRADESGYLVSQITPEGFLRLECLGGAKVAAARSRRLRILGDRGEVAGIIGNLAIHLREHNLATKAPGVHELFVDIGASNAQEVADRGIRVGHPAVFADAAETLGKNRLMGRGLERRLGSFVVAEVLRQISESRAKPEASVVARNTAQEEAGVPNTTPDAIITLEVTQATDSPGIDTAKHGTINLGGGPKITRGAAHHPPLYERLTQAAKDLDISIQHETKPSSPDTDAKSLHRPSEDIATCRVALPIRYTHSAVEVADLNDVKNTIRLLTGFVKSLKAGDSFKP